MNDCLFIIEVVSFTNKIKAFFQPMITAKKGFMPSEV